MVLRLASLFCLLFSAALARAQILGPSVEEVSFSYTAEFLTDEQGTPAEDLARDHSQYIFGVFHSPAMIEKYGLDPEMVGGLGSPRSDVTIRILKFEDSQRDLVHVKYQAWGKMILHKRAAQKALDAGFIAIPLPADLTRIYDEKCTDPHYSSFGDYWYFWDPLTKTSCRYLSREPYSSRVKIAVRATKPVNPDVTPRLDLLRGDNGNGRVFSVYVIHGFAESSSDPDDDGRLNFQELNQYFRSLGYRQTIERKANSRPLYTYSKTITLPDGHDIDVEIRHLLVETGIESRSTTFAKFFKEAVENADVIIYGGHSGLGGNLDIEALEEKAGPFRFNQKKRQMFFFDSCASYSYYLKQFSEEKTKSKIDLLTYGLSSYFHTSEAILEELFRALLNTQKKDMSWQEILQAMEKPLYGGSFLLSVGGI